VKQLPSARTAGCLAALTGLTAALVLAAGAGAVPRAEPCAPSGTSTATAATARPVTVGARAENAGRPRVVDVSKLPERAATTRGRKNPPPARTQPGQRRAKTLKSATSGCLPHSAPTVGSAPTRH
jgi:hypothetical protein